MMTVINRPFRFGEYEFGWDAEAVSPDYSAKVRKGSYVAALDIHRDGVTGSFGGAVFVFLRSRGPAGSKAVRTRVIPCVEPTVERAAQVLIKEVTAVFTELLA